MLGELLAMRGCDGGRAMAAAVETLVEVLGSALTREVRAACPGRCCLAGAPATPIEGPGFRLTTGGRSASVLRFNPWCSRNSCTSSSLDFDRGVVAVDAVESGMAGLGRLGGR